MQKKHSHIKFDFFYIEDVIYCEAYGKNTVICIKNKSSIILQNEINHFEKTLKEFGFYRLHKSYLINLNYIEKIIKKDKNYLVVAGNHHLVLSQAKKEFQEFFDKKINADAPFIF